MVELSETQTVDYGAADDEIGWDHPPYGPVRPLQSRRVIRQDPVGDVSHETTVTIARLRDDFVEGVQWLEALDAIPVESVPEPAREQLLQDLEG